jgi:SAM-dependent methyltransferase
MNAKSRSTFRRSPTEGGAPRPKAGEALAARIPSLVEAWRKDRGLPEKGELGKREIETAAASLLALQRGLTGGRRLAGSPYMEDSGLLGAYLLYYWPVSYMQVALSLAAAPHAAAPFSPERVLDLGSGPGPASAAILDASRASGAPGPRELVLVDSSRKALDLASSILERRVEQGVAREAARPTKLSTVLLDLEAAAELPAGSFDLIVMGHCLNELWRGESDALERRLRLVRQAAGSLSPGGRILLVEPALLLTCRELIALRDRLAMDGLRVLSPCPGSYPCPAFAAGPDRSCHAESPWAAPESVASLAKAAGLDRESVKWSYFILDSAAAPYPADETPLAETRRVVSDPMLNKAGRLRYILCGNARLETISARADDEAARASGFMRLRRGDIVKALDLEERAGGGLGLGPRSSLETISLAPEASS